MNPRDTVSCSERSSRSTASRRARLELSLRRLEEEKELKKKQMALDLEKQFADQKYQLLEQSLAQEEDFGNRSVRDRVDDIEKRSQVSQWVKQQSQLGSLKATNSQLYSGSKSENGVPTGPIVLITDERGAVGGNGINPSSQIGAPSKQQSNTITQPEKNSDDDVVRLLQDQLTFYRENPSTNRLQHVREQLERCLGLGLVQSVHQTDTSNEKRQHADQSKGAIRKTSGPSSHLFVASHVNQATGNKITVHDSESRRNPRAAPVDSTTIQVSNSRSNVAVEDRIRVVPDQRQQMYSGLYTAPHQSCELLPPITAIPAPILSSVHGGAGNSGLPEPHSNAFISRHPVPPPVNIEFPSVLPPVSATGCLRDTSTTATVFRPTPEQISARHVMPRDLPDFSGDPEDWPLFLSSFNNSTAACGYNHAENLARLQRCLKGDARKAVQYYLLSPESVPDVLDTLRTLFGRPEILINKLIRNVRDCPMPKGERLETLIDFGMTVRNLTHHLLAAGQHAHLSNPVLLQELIEKLPANIKLQWAQHLDYFPVPSLQTFSDFMARVVDSVAKVVPYGGSSGKTDRPKAKEKGFVHAHMEKVDSSTVRQAVPSDKSCLVCDKSGHRVKDCGKFKGSNIEERWKTVHSLKLCRCCLSPHGRRFCKSSNVCGINGCQYRHHQLLHFNPSTNNRSASVPVEEHHNYHHCGQSVLFRIVQVTLHGADGSINAFALLDEGSSTTEELNVSGPTVPLCLTWTGNMSRSEE